MSQRERAGFCRPIDEGLEDDLDHFRLVSAIYADSHEENFLLTQYGETWIWRTVGCPHVQHIGRIQ